MGQGRSHWRLAVVLILGVLALPIWADGGAARAAVDGLSAAGAVIRQRQRDERAPAFKAPGVEVREQKQAKLDSTLALVSRAASGRGGQNPLDVARSREVDVVHNALVRVVVESTGARQQALNAIRSAGGVVEAEYRELVQALVAPQQLDALAADAGVAYVRQPARPFKDAVGGEGAGASGASVWHVEGFTGQNVKVGVIDLGFTGYQTRQAQGDLPNTLTLVDFCGGQTTPAGGEHGTAVAEIVYEMAPGIELYLLCIGTEVQLGQAKDYAKANGISILVMSMSWFNTSRGDGTGSASSPNATVADARANGILWVNSAGNRAQQHYGAFFNDADNNDAHNFNGTDEGNTIPLAAGQTTCVFLKWDAWPTTNQDFDLYLTVSQTGTIVAASVGDQNGTQTPTEAFCYANTTGVSQNFAIFIDRFSATTTPYMDLFITPGPNLEYQVPTGSVTEPGTSPNAMTVAAICWQNDRREDYSGIGPTIDGRIKPDIAGQTAVSSGSFGPWVSCPGGSNGQGGFNGTSAATPHVGGAAALVKGANPSYTPAQVQAFLEGRATELGPAGKDNLFGSGKLQLGAAPLPPVACSPRPPVTVQTTISGGRQNVAVSVTGANNRLLSISFGAGGSTPANALLDLPDGQVGLTGTPVWTAGAGVTQTTFYVRRQAAGPVTVPFVVADRCGVWTTFVGGGAGATGF